jgi:hypothetical protein
MGRMRATVMWALFNSPLIMSNGSSATATCCCCRRCCCRRRCCCHRRHHHCWRLLSCSSANVSALLLPPPPPPLLAPALVQLCECICKMLVNCFRSTKHRSCVEKALAEQGDHRHQPRRQPPGLVQRDRQSHLLQEPAWGSDCIGRAAPDVPWAAD